MNSIKNSTVIVTGAAGFIGKCLCRRLSEQGVAVAGIDRIDNSNIDCSKFFVGDLSNSIFLKDVIAKIQPTHVYHLAANIDRSREKEKFSSIFIENLTITECLFSSLISHAHELRAVVVMGTAEEYGDNRSPFTEEMQPRPISHYSFSKIEILNLARYFNKQWGMPFIHVRPTVAYGIGQNSTMFLHSLISSLMKGKPFKMTLGAQTRDFLHVDDLVTGLLQLSINPYAIGETVNIGSGIPFKLIDVANMVGSILGCSNLLRPGAVPYRKDEIMRYEVSIEKMKSITGWKPRIALKEGIQKLIDTYSNSSHASC